MMLPKQAPQLPEWQVATKGPARLALLTTSQQHQQQQHQQQHQQQLSNEGAAIEREMASQALRAAIEREYAQSTS